MLPSFEKLRVFFKGFEHFEGKMDISFSEADIMSKAKKPDKLQSIFDNVRKSFGLGDESLNFIGTVESQGKKGLINIGGTVKGGEQNYVRYLCLLIIQNKIR